MKLHLLNDAYKYIYCVCHSVYVVEEVSVPSDQWSIFNSALFFTYLKESVIELNNETFYLKLN